MDDLSAFVTARLDEDEAAAKAAPRGPWETCADGCCVIDVAERCEGDSAAHIVRHDPARVLREVEAGRKVLEMYVNSLDASGLFREKLGTGTHMAVAAESYLNVIRGLAAIWSDHQDYRPEWKP